MDLKKHATAIIISCCLIIGLFSGMFLTQYAYNHDIGTKIKNSLSIIHSENEDGYDEMIEECYFENDIQGTLTCVRNRLMIDYKYVITSDIVTLSFDELLETGGDCQNWNDLWGNIGRDYYYDVEDVIVESRNGTFHIFSIISETEGYCLVDQMIVECFLY